jgi:hypothetical protein
VPLPGLLIDTDTASDGAAPNVTLVRRVNADGFRALLFEPCATTPGTAERLRPVRGAA